MYVLLPKTWNIALNMSCGPQQRVQGGQPIMPSSQAHFGWDENVAAFCHALDMCETKLLTSDVAGMKVWLALQPYIPQ